MSISSFAPRAVRKAAVVCLLVTTSLATFFASRSAAGTTPRSPTPATHSIGASGTRLDPSVRGLHSSAPTTLRADGQDVLAFAPPKDTGERPLTVVYLHGIHGRAANGCPWFRPGASDVGWLVCPKGVEQDENGTASWGGDVFKQGAVVASALRAAQQRGASDEPGVVVGFSQGGYVALDLVRAHLGHFRGLVLLAAPEAHPSATRVTPASLSFCALGAGSLDAAYAPLVEDAKRLANEGIETRFVDLGRVGHTYIAEHPEALRAAIAWAGGRA
jgi:predicted esterase